MMQLALFASPALPCAGPYVERLRKEVMTLPGLITIYADAPRPCRITVASIKTGISCSVGLCTRTIDLPGTPYCSETEFRSFGAMLTDPTDISECIHHY